LPGNLVRDRRGDELGELTLWLFASSGVTESAKKLMAQNGILWSTKADLNALLNFSDLKELPDID